MHQPPCINSLVQDIEESTACPGLPMSDVSLSLDHLHEAFSQIKPSLSPGPDNLPPAFLKLLGPRVSSPLLTIFQSFLDNAVIPDAWKRALVTPIHKGKGKPMNDVSSYRPVSVTSILCRTFERLLNRCLLDYLIGSNSLSTSQHGFRPGRSCETALATITHHISDALDDRTPTDLVQLDYSDAFDTLDHLLLLKKLAGAGVRGSLLRWIANFLIGRSHRVVFHGSSSDDFTVSSGVPQGSVLGPTLFSIYVNDMPKTEDTLVIQYADDTTILARLDSPSSSSRLQNHLTQIVDWSTSNHLRLSRTKTAVMRFSSQKKMQPPCYSISGTPVSVAMDLRILGVTFTPSLNFTVHIANIVAKARRTLGFVTRVSRHCGPESFRALHSAGAPTPRVLRVHLESPSSPPYAASRGCPASRNKDAIGALTVATPQPTAI